VLTVGEAARRLGVWPQAVRQMLGRTPRPLTAERRGGIWLIADDARLAAYRVGAQQQRAARARRAGRGDGRAR